MKKTILALVAAIVAGSVFAAPSVATGSVTGSAASQVSGATGSFSLANKPGQTSFHGSIATAQNCTTVVGVSRPGTNGAYAATAAVTTGSTFTAGGGSGVGGTFAGASQFGMGSVTAGASVNGRATGSVEASSFVATGTMSTVSTTDSGFGVSGTIAGAANASSALAGSNAILGGVSVRTAGTSIGVDGVKTFGNSSPTNASIEATGTLSNGGVSNIGSYQAGSFNATITRDFSADTTGIGGPSGCVGSDCAPKGKEPKEPKEPKDKKPKGNNGLGNGDQSAPGNSLDNNNAENGGDGPHKGSGKPSKKN